MSNLMQDGNPASYKWYTADIMFPGIGELRPRAQMDVIAVGMDEAQNQLSKVLPENAEIKGIHYHGTYTEWLEEQDILEEIGKEAEADTEEL